MPSEDIESKAATRGDDDHPLIHLARKEFGTLTDHEVALFSATAKGKSTDCDGQTIFANRLLWLCTDKQALQYVLPHKGVNVTNARVEGELQLTDAEIPFVLALLRCKMETLALRGAHLRALLLDGTRLTSLRGERLQVEHDVHLRDGFSTQNEVHLHEATIKGNLDCSGGILDNANGASLTCPRMTVGGSVLLTRGFRSAGTVNLQLANIAGDLDCSSALLRNPGASALIANEARIGGSVLLGNGLSSVGAVTLAGAEIEGSLHLAGASFSNPDGIALSADTAKIRGGILGRDEFEAEGEVYLPRETPSGSSSPEVQTQAPDKAPQVFSDSFDAYIPGKKPEPAPRGKVQPQVPDQPPEAIPDPAGPQLPPEEPPATPRRKVQPVSTRMISDAPVTDAADDLLGYSVYADALAGLIDNPETTTPLTIAVNAPWGAGKSTIAALIKQSLEKKRLAGKHHVVCEFNAWMHDDAGNVGSALVGQVARTADRERSWHLRLLRPLSSRLAPRGARPWRGPLFLLIICVAIALGLYGLSSTEVAPILAKMVPALQNPVPQETAGETAPANSANDPGEEGGGGDPVVGAQPIRDSDAGTSRPGGERTPPNTKTGSRLMIAAVFLVGFLPLFRWVFQAATEVSSFVSKPEADASSGTIGEVRKQLHRLIGQGTRRGSRFVVMIDDVERCRPPKAMDVLEAVNQLLNRENVVTVVLADLPMVAAAAEQKYQALAEKLTHYGGTQGHGKSRHSFGRLYLQKFIQVQFDLPTLSNERLQAFAERLTTDQPPTGEGRQ